jgi:hypothetical protein
VRERVGGVEENFAAASEDAQAVAEYPLLIHVLVVGVERGAIFFKPLRALVPADDFD